MHIFNVHNSVFMEKITKIRKIINFDGELYIELSKIKNKSSLIRTAVREYLFKQ